MSANDEDLEVYEYIFQGKTGETVPAPVEKLIIDQGVQVLPDDLCHYRQRLREVTLHEGLTGIANRVFYSCPNLLEIKIGSMVQFIGQRACHECTRLTKVEFESTTSSPHQLRTIGDVAFQPCLSLPRIKLPSSVTSVGERAFYNCSALTEANLSTTGLTKISGQAFSWCSSLQTVCLPNTLERICNHAFRRCHELVTVLVPLDDSQPINIGDGSFQGCRRLAVLLLPKDSTAEENSFTQCDLLHERYGEDISGIVAGLIGRFDEFPIHRVCYYDHSLITIQALRQCIADQQEGDSLVDAFGMTPFHVFFSGAEPRMELLDVLLESLPNQTLLKLKDANGRRPLDYLINNWSDGAKILLQRTLQKWMVDPLARWGAASWTEAIQGKVQELLDEDDKSSRSTLYNEAYSALEHYENIETISILEMALWKWKLKSGWTRDGTKGQALDRDECRCLSGSNVVIPHVDMFLDIRRACLQDK